MALCVRIDVQDKICVVFGGGNEGFRRAVQLQQENARVTVYAPKFCQKFAEYPNLCKTKAYHSHLLQGVFLAAACTDNPEINTQIVRDCIKKGILILSSTKEKECPFHPMANRNWSQGLVAVSVPNVPALASKMAEELANHAEIFAPKAKALAQLRVTLKQKLTQEQFSTVMKHAPDCSLEQIQCQIKKVIHKK